MKASSEKVRNTVSSTAVGAAITASVVMEVVGNDVASELNQAPVTLKTVTQIALSRFQTKLHISN